ncbi:precorrin-2 C(20)-methyltransferase [Thalassobaculum fulvum]|uniref:Precorrin-2 C(20)-methyltransferase n=1 Tax=Thalassobaculum fulvum TaxID=1633335 RepID=A0A918XUZ4_9PROT|nr:precorrin-2 C(20)-methyltransferase [Thalassobaculum fulvum]GHD57603.1 precorrin-2 C(20)-methyltransferase [Thalassobaculum fulvum]
MSGTLYGLGVGPGDPELLTLKALRLLRAVDVVAYPALEDGDSLARAIVAGHLPDGVEEYAIRIPMTVARAPAQAVYDVAAGYLGAALDAGRSVAVLCEGDPFFYGSFMYLFGRLAERHRVEVVPGVSSLTACAARLGSPLAARNDTLAVLPAPLADEVLAARLDGVDAAAIIKVGRHFPRVRALLDRLGLADRARYVERATMGTERILPLDAVESDGAPYFSTILIHRRGEAWS